MAIIATTNGTFERELLAAGTYVARCYQMIHIGTVEEMILGEKKVMNKVRLTFELPYEMRVFKEENGEHPLVISKEFTLSMHEKSGLRNFLKNWRGKDFSDTEAASFDVSKLIGVPCMLNVIHKDSKKGVTYAEIGNVSPLMKGMSCPDQINPSQELSYDNFNWELFEKQPDFIKDKMRASLEFARLNFTANVMHSQEPKPSAMAMSEAPAQLISDIADDLPF